MEQFLDKRIKDSVFRRAGITWSAQCSNAVKIKNPIPHIPIQQRKNPFNKIQEVFIVSIQCTQIPGAGGIFMSQRIQ